MHSQTLKEAWARDDGTRRSKTSRCTKEVYQANKDKITKARLKAKAKHYGKIISPEGEIFDIYNAQSFIREHDFSQGFYNMLNGKCAYYKGWKRFKQSV